MTSDEILSAYNLDKTAFAVGDVSGPSDEPAFWAAKTPQERMSALEFMRVIAYGYDPATARLQRLLEVAEVADLT
jgi:hypothetical protein